MPVRVIVLASVVALVGLAAPASAELVFLKSGRSLSVKHVRVDGESMILSLRNGGEVVCDRAIVERVEPDEIPYPEAEVPAARPVAGGASADGGIPMMSGAMAAAPSDAEADQVRTAGAARGTLPLQYRALVATLAGEHGVDAGLVHAVIAVESAYQPRARSRKGAKGLMQLMPATARQYGVRNAYSPAANLDAGIKHLRALLDRFEVSLALAAYNAGEATVRRFGGIPPYPETQEYVARVLALAGGIRPGVPPASVAVVQQ